MFYTATLYSTMLYIRSDLACLLLKTEILWKFELVPR